MSRQIGAGTVEQIHFVPVIIQSQFRQAVPALALLAIAAIDARRYIIPNELARVAFVLAIGRAGLVGPDAGWAAR